MKTDIPCGCVMEKNKEKQKNLICTSAKSGSFYSVVACFWTIYSFKGFGIFIQYVSCLYKQNYSMHMLFTNMVLTVVL